MNFPVDQITLWQLLGLTLLFGVGMARFGNPHRPVDRLVFGLFSGVLLLRYAIWRTNDTLPDATHGFASVWSYVFYAFEMVSVVYTLATIVVMVRRRDSRPFADAGEARLRAAGRDVPAVDVFIATYNEDLQILEKTIVSAKAIDYPHVNVWVLDDTRRDWLRDYCARMGVHYLRRPDNRHAKAGNLNNGLKLSAQETNAPYILVLDADFAPQKNILYRVMGLFHERKVALVQTPQFYYNADPIQHNLGATDSWVDEQRVFFDVFQPSRDAWDSAFCVGTSFVVSRRAITEAGGFPTDSVCEDIHTTYVLRRNGYITRWLNERLSVGLSAEGLIEYINQRGRWCLGTMQVAMLKDGPLRGKGYNLIDRLHYVHGMLHWIGKPFLLLMLIAPVLYWYFGIAAFYTTPQAFMFYGMPALLGFWFYGPWITERKTLPIFTEVTQLVAAYAVTMTMISACFRPFGRPFKVTAKGLDRSKVVVHWKLAGFFIALMLFLQAGAANTILTAPMSGGIIFNLAWTLIALVLDLAAIIACVDLPRLRHEERFPYSHATYWRQGHHVQSSEFIDISLSGAAMRHSPVMPVPGEMLEVSVPDVGWVPARVARLSKHRLCVQFEPNEAMRHRLIRLIFCHTPHNIAVKARPLRAFAQLMRAAGVSLPPR
ncbi:glycosyltransferase [Dyella psychrodurans]|uniref:Cellulose synthase catalytic subunit [UDP-forming] n=1 Tax=Dyella psychrodurans TaxID=1927960 RepID=A0A370XA63_9GAMM|nr:glycosyltransferase [Dyella psychrodurans]RDS85314.1 glycosyltransferase [Dyella psychrodurans]